MIEIISLLAHILYCIVMDYVVYIAIDALLYKYALSKTSDRVVQRNLWLQESMTTLCAAFLLHLVSHTPRLLYFLSLFTCFYGLSRSLLTLSEVYLAAYRLSCAISLARDHIALWFHRWRRRRFLTHHRGSTLAGDVNDNGFELQCRQEVPSSVARIAQQRFKSPRIAGQLLFASPLLHECTTTPIRVQRNILTHKTPINSYNRRQPPQTISETGGCNWLLRQPLCTTKSQHKEKPLAAGTFAKVRSAILGEDCDRISNLKRRIGMRLMDGVSGFVQNRQHTSLPSGLRNNGVDMSFLNCIVQVLRQSPGVERLCHSDSNAWLVNKSRSVSHEDMLDSLRALLCSSSQSLDTMKLCRSAAHLCPFSLLPNATTPQAQQDAAVCFEWLLEATQDAIAAPNYGNLSGVPAPRFWSKWLDSISKDYSRATGASTCVISPARMTRLASTARNQLLYGSAASSMAELLRCESTVRLMRRIVDLDWWLMLSSRAATDAACLARLFEGQLMDASICLTCHRVHVESKPFRLLSVTLPRGKTTAVTLTECLTHSVGLTQYFTGLVCEQCLSLNKSVATNVPGGVAVPLSPIVGLTSSLIGGTTTSTPLCGLALHGTNTSTPTTVLNQGIATPHQMMLLIARAPPILAIHLKRFGSDIGRINTRVLLPQELELREMCLDDDALEDAVVRVDSHFLPIVYRLYGCVLHKPSADGGSKGLSGHYSTVCKMFDANSNTNQQWIRCEDESVRPIVTDEEAWRELRCDEGASQVYLAFYSRSS